MKMKNSVKLAAFLLLVAGCGGALGASVVERNGALVAVGTDPDQGSSLEQAQSASQRYCQEHGGGSAERLGLTQRLEGQSQHTELRFRCASASSGGAAPAH